MTTRWFCHTGHRLALGPAHDQQPPPQPVFFQIQEGTSDVDVASLIIASTSLLGPVGRRFCAAIDCALIAPQFRGRLTDSERRPTSSGERGAGPWSHTVRWGRLWWMSSTPLRSVLRCSGGCYRYSQPSGGHLSNSLPRPAGTVTQTSPKRAEHKAIYNTIALPCGDVRGHDGVVFGHSTAYFSSPDATRQVPSRRT